MKRLFAITLATVIMSAGAALADPIEGNWKTQSGETAGIAKCGGSFCITLKTGDHKGKQIGKMQATGNGKYKGKITDPAEDKTYTGKASLSGSSMKMSGCVFGGLLCQSQSWQKL